MAAAERKKDFVNKKEEGKAVKSQKSLLIGRDTTVGKREKANFLRPP
jgi:hypothetical protein